MLTIRLDGRDVQVTLPRASLSRLEVSRGRRSHSTLKGAGTGMVIGATLGALIGLASGDDRGNCFVCFRAQDKAGMGALVLGTLGGLVGAGAGAQDVERWETVAPRPAKLRVSVRPLGRSGLSLALAF
jgi:hypothetical protein